MAIYTVKNQWGGKNKPWNDGGSWVLGCRPDQDFIHIHIASVDGGKTLTGEMTYQGEGPIGVRATLISGNNYQVENQWGGDDAEWHPGGMWIIGSRNEQNVVSLNISKEENSNVMGTMTYFGEGPIGFEGSKIPGSSYQVENQWGGNDAKWNVAGSFILGTRAHQNPVEFDISSDDAGKTFGGTMTYAGEGPIGFKAELKDGNNYDVQNQWGGDKAPWNDAGDMVIGSRDNQGVIKMKIASEDDGKTFTGEMTYEGEGPIGFKGALSTC